MGFIKLIDFETEGKGTDLDYITVFKSKLTEDVRANYDFLSQLYKKRKAFVDENWDKGVNILESGKITDENKELIEELNHYINQEYALLYWLRDEYFTEHAQILDKERSGIKTNQESIFPNIEQEELDALSEKTIELEKLIKDNMVMGE